MIDNKKKQTKRNEQITMYSPLLARKPSLLNPIQSNQIAEKKYETLNKGKTAFEVFIKGTCVSVRNPITSWPPSTHLIVDSSLMMLGRSPSNKLTKISGEIGLEGNSMILRSVKDTDSYHHWFIGDRIIKFKSLAPIVYFTSPVGKNKIPYPWAQDLFGNIYLFDENVVLTKHPFSPTRSSRKEYSNDKEKDHWDVYGYFDEKLLHFPCTNSNGGKLYQLTWYPYPEQVVKRLLKSGELRGKPENEIIELGEHVWCNAIRQYGQSVGISPLNIVEVIKDHSC